MSEGGARHGRGFEPATVDHRPGHGGFGLLGMIERVTSLGGRNVTQADPRQEASAATGYSSL